MTTTCRDCGRPLTDPVSRADGRGPVCGGRTRHAAPRLAAPARAGNPNQIPLPLEATVDEQPDGIADDSTDLPDPARAAERVNEFLAWYGDGLIDAGEAGGPPLFARDLQALANLATREGAAVREFCADRAEYVRVLRQCTDATADYHRWQGHAEARRQLSERLGLPTAWPATAQEGPAA